MKHATRILALMLSIAMLLALAACGGSAASTASAPAEEASAPAPVEEAAPAEQAAAPAEAEPAVEEAAASAAEASAAEPAEEPAPELPVVEYPLFDETHTYTIWLGTAPDLNDVVKNMEEFVIFRELEKVTNVTWDATMVSFMAESEQFQLMVAGGDFTDVVCKAIDNYNGTVDQAIEEDFLIDLTPYIEDNMPNLLTWFQTYPELRKALMSNDGAIGGFPKFYREYSDIASGPMIRADWLDQLGLDAIDRRLLQSIILHYGGGPVGLETLAATINEEAVTIEDVYEPFLMQQGFLTRTPRGRCATRLAYAHLGLPYPEQPAKRPGLDGQIGFED